MQGDAARLQFAGVVKHVHVDPGDGGDLGRSKDIGSQYLVISEFLDFALYLTQSILQFFTGCHANSYARVCKKIYPLSGVFYRTLCKVASSCYKHTKLQECLAIQYSNALICTTHALRNDFQTQILQSLEFKYSNLHPWLTFLCDLPCRMT